MHLYTRLIAQGTVHSLNGTDGEGLIKVGAVLRGELFSGSEGVMEGRVWVVKAMEGVTSSCVRISSEVVKR